MRTISQDTLDSFGAGDNLLVLSPTFSATEPMTCSDLLTRAGTDREHVLCITFTRSPEDHIVNWRRHENLPERAAFVDVDASPGSNPRLGDGTDYSTTRDVDVTVDRVSSPENLTRLGVRTTNRLDAITDEVGDRQVVACFDSVTSLLQYVDRDQAFRFLHVVTDHLTEAGAIAHFHMDPGAHDDETLETLKSLFDDVLTVDN